jgi:hypothetical protein
MPERPGTSKGFAVPRRPIVRLIAVALLAAACVGALSACDTDREARLVKVVTTGAPDDTSTGTRRGSADTTVIWIGHGRARAISSRGDLLYDKRTDTLYGIDNVDSVVVSMAASDFARIRRSLEPGPDATPEEQRRITALRQLEDVRVSVRPTPLQVQLGDYDCRKYVVDMVIGPVVSHSEYWVTQDIHIDAELFRALTQTTLIGLPGATAALAELDKIEGLPVLTTGVVEVNGSVSHTTSRLVDVHYGDVPDELLELPPGYAVTPADSVR